MKTLRIFREFEKTRKKNEWVCHEKLQIRALKFELRENSQQIRTLFNLKIKITRIRFENHPNTNRNNIRVEKITRIQIRIIFNSKKSPEYKYEYKYSA